VASGNLQRLILRLSSLFPHITFSTCVHDHSVVLDPELTFSHHINLIARKCYHQLRQLRVVSRSLTHQSTLTLVHAFVTSRIDCCSSLLVGLPIGTLARLDRIPHSAARLLGRLPKFSSITAYKPYMRNVLHWLPISQQIHYRITAMVSQCVLRCTSSYLYDLCCPVSVLVAPWVLLSAARSELLEGWAFGPSSPFSYCAVKGLFNCWPISLEWSPRWTAFLVDGPPFQILHLREVLLFGCDWAGSASE